MLPPQRGNLVCLKWISLAVLCATHPFVHLLHNSNTRISLANVPVFVFMTHVYLCLGAGKFPCAVHHRIPSAEKEAWNTAGAQRAAEEKQGLNE